MAADGKSSAQQILQNVLDQTNQAIKITGSITTTPPVGGATSAKQDVGNASLASIDSKLTDTTGGALKVDGSAFTQPVSGSVSVSNFPATQPVSGTVTANQGTTPWVTDGSGTTQPISAASLPLPTGAATSANQTTGNSSLSSIDGKIVHVDTGAVVVSSSALPTGAATSAAQATGNASLSSLDGKTVHVDTGAVVVSSSALPSGAATAAKQDTGNASLASIDSKIPALGQAVSASSVPVVIASNQSAVPVSQSGSWTVAATQSGTWNINNISGTISLPTGAATSAKQPALGTAGTASADVITVQGIASMTPLLVNGSGSTQPISGTVAATQSGTWTVQPGNTANTTPWLATINQGGNSATVSAGGALKVDGSAVTQPVSGTVTANIGTTNGLALDTTVAKLNVAQSTALGANTGPMVQGSVTTAAPTYTTGNINPLSLTVSGGLRVDGSGSTQPVSGTVAATQSGAWNITNITGTVSLPTGASTEAKQDAGNASLASIDSKTPSGLTVTGGRLQVDGSGVTQPVSGTVTANQGGSWTVAATQSGAWSTGRTWTLSSGTDSVAVSGTVAVTQSTSPWVVSNTALSNGPHAPVLFDGSTIQAAGGTRQLVAALTGDLKRLQIGDTTGLFIGIYDALTSGNLIFIINPGMDVPIDIGISGGTSLYAISMTADAGGAGTYISFNFLG